MASHCCAPRCIEHVTRHIRCLGAPKAKTKRSRLTRGFQTGNTIFLALGASNQNNKPYDWARSLCSIGCFIIGSLFFSRLYRWFGSQNLQRGPLALSFFIQAALVCIAAALVQAGAVNQAQSDGGATDCESFLRLKLVVKTHKLVTSPPFLFAGRTFLVVELR